MSRCRIDLCCKLPPVDLPVRTIYDCSRDQCRTLELGLTQNDEFNCELGSCVTGRQLMTAVDTGVFKRHWTDCQLTESSRLVTDDAVFCLERRAKTQTSVNDLWLVAVWRVEVPAERVDTPTAL